MRRPVRRTTKGANDKEKGQMKQVTAVCYERCEGERNGRRNGERQDEHQSNSDRGEADEGGYIADSLEVELSL